jgi:hypothetical protein
MKRNKEWLTVLRWFAEDFSRLELLRLTDKDWDKLKLDLHDILLPGEKGNITPGTNYDIAFNRVAVGEAHRNVRGVLQLITQRNKQVLEKNPNEDPNNLRQEIYPLLIEEASMDALPKVGDGKILKVRFPTKLNVIIEPNGMVWTGYSTAHLPTWVYLTFCDALRYSGVTGQILICDNRNCERIFLANRKPREDRTGHYCSYTCCHRESTRRYREDGNTHESYKAVERQRVAAYYQPRKKKKRAANPRKMKAKKLA